LTLGGKQKISAINRKSCKATGKGKERDPGKKCTLLPVHPKLCNSLKECFSIKLLNWGGWGGRGEVYFPKVREEEEQIFATIDVERLVYFSSYSL
jgi:hypothetical protein